MGEQGTIFGILFGAFFIIFLILGGALSHVI